MPFERFDFGATVIHAGETPEPTGVRFRVWAPAAERVDLLLEDEAGRIMAPLGQGLFEAVVSGPKVGATYRYRLDQADPLPDPASRWQPEGVFGPSQVVDPRAYAWHDQEWQGIPREQLVFYELHVGTFTPQGDFAAVQGKLGYLQGLGVTAIELMPVHDFPGRWNWGYDPAALWAPSRAYGTPDALRALVDEAHQRGIAVFLDVVYNHFGPDGAYAVAYAPFLTELHHTGWGRAVNLDGPEASLVRAFLIENAIHWLEEYHIDGLRLDATFALVDDSPKHFLADLAERVADLAGPRRQLIAEDDRNLARLVRPVTNGGYGMDAVWADDFHHLVRRITAGDTHAYYQDYPASIPALAESIEQGWYFQGQFSRFWGRPRGTDPRDLDKDRFVFCIQNHDQIGNRPMGDRLHHALDPSLYRALSSLLLYLPELPLLFMGQEWAASSPFCYFTDHHEELGRAVTEGRRAEFSDFPNLTAEVPNPQDPDTFERSKLVWQECDQMPHVGTLRLYRDLLSRRGELSGEVQARPQEDGLVVQRGRQILAVALLAGAALQVGEGCRVLWHSEQPEYGERSRPPLLKGSVARFPAAAALLLEGPA